MIRPSPRRRAGMSIAEVLIGLSITAMLLTAIAASFSSSASVIENNDQFFRATQAARVTMNQLLTDIRRAHAVSVASNRLDVIAFNNTDHSYVYDSTGRALRLVTNDIPDDPDYVLADNVTTCAFSADMRRDDGGINHVVRVAVTLDVRIGDNHLRLTGSAAPRRERVYE